jgi:hypothetical protein
MHNIIVCDSCGDSAHAHLFRGGYFPDIDWTMCLACQDEGRLDEWPDAGTPCAAFSNYFV